MATRTRKASSYDKKMQRLVEAWQREFGSEVIDPDRVAQWLVATGRWARKPPTAVQLCRRDISRALRMVYYMDPQDREVRVKHPVKGETGTLYYDIRIARPEPIYVSLQIRRNGILHDCMQCKTDYDSYNDNNRFQATLPQMEFNFNPDLEEMEQPTDYPDEKPDDPRDS